MTAEQPVASEGDGDGRAVGSGRPLRREFFSRPAAVVAHELVGALLLRTGEGLAARIVETEAYTEDEPSCHAWRGRTARNAPLFGPPGHAYVYFTYGMHWLLNIVTGEEGRGEGCLLRAAEPLAGLATMRERRGARPDRELLRGPARLAQAFGVGQGWSGTDLCDGGPLQLAADGAAPPVAVSPRVGIAEAAEIPWRFVAEGSRWASAYKRHPRAG